MNWKKFEGIENITPKGQFLVYAFIDPKNDNSTVQVECPCHNPLNTQQDLKDYFLENERNKIVAYREIDFTKFKWTQPKINQPYYIVDKFGLSLETYCDTELEKLTTFPPLEGFKTPYWVFANEEFKLDNVLIINEIINQ